MKRTAIQEMKRKPKAELEKMLVEFRDRLWTLTNDLGNGKVKNVREVREVKKNIARAETFLRLPMPA